MTTPYRITDPDIYYDMRAEDYFADPAPLPSLNQSTAKVIIEHSPLHAWWQHPRLNPAYERDDATKFDIGNVAHLYLTGHGRDVEVIEAEDWRTKAAKEAREGALSRGKLPILVSQDERAREMVTAARDQLHFVDPAAFADGDGEVVLAWREDDIWLRAMVDWLEADNRTVWDLKTTSASAAPHALSAKMAADGWCIQAAMHERGLDALDPVSAGRRKHRFVCVECEPPYALTVTELTEAAMTIGRKQLQYAVDVWRDCVRANRWPGYPRELLRLDYPGWAEARWLEREIEEDERRRTPMLTSLAGG